VSFGAGMANIALARTRRTRAWSSRSCPWWGLDRLLKSARAVGKTASQMCAIKEKGVNLSSPNGREEQAIVLYVRSLINYVLTNIGGQFKKVSNDVSLPEAIPFVVSGGTSKAPGFIDLFKEEFDQVRKKFPIQISEIRMAKDP
jgi:hypothetical protein